MANLHIQRQHAMGLDEARKIALSWAAQIKEKFEMECHYQEGDGSDMLAFSRSGVTGTLQVTDQAFELHAKLGFLLGAFKDRIEAEVVKNLDELLASQRAGTTTT
jgi:putative polyhydroxyalkanoate system protein